MSTNSHNFPKDLLSISDLNSEQIEEVLDAALTLKKNRHTHPKHLFGKTIGILTSKPSLRTRLSFEIGLAELGANSIFIKEEEIGLGQRESYEDVSRVISRLLSGLIIRSHKHENVAQMAQIAKIPIINALTNLEHPCQILADFLTVKEYFGQLKDIKICFIGDGNNVSISLMLGSAIAGLNCTVITPPGHEPPKSSVDKATQLAKHFGSQMPSITNDIQAADSANILYTDVWISMGQDTSKDKALRTFENYQINNQTTRNGEIPVLHCLPAHKGEEITEEIFEKNADLIFTQAENRLHSQKSLLVKLLC
ncbi:MAG: ornithine carbamoyltransferase [Candidatus Caenarcaniphilales bacterium]|nr:ornithine carbamoyltransferase [Candidatus Caenarcaniphilales bacterium]